MLLRSNYDENTDRYTLDAPEPSARRQEGIYLTDIEWADYQRVIAEFNGWQDRIHNSPIAPIDADPECVAAESRWRRQQEEARAAHKAGFDRLQAAIDAGILIETKPE